MADGSIGLQVNALIDVEFYRIHSGKKEDDQIPDEDRVTLFINAASDELERACGRKFITPAAAIEEIFDGNGRPKRYVDQCRILSDPAPEVHYLQRPSTWVELTSPTYVWRIVTDDGLIEFLSVHTFTAGRLWRLTYSYGWTRAALPSDIKQVCAEIVSRMIKLAGGLEGIKTKTVVGQSGSSFNLAELPDNLLRVIDSYSSGRVS